MEPGSLTPGQLFTGCLRHTHQVSTKKTNGHLMAHSIVVNRDWKYAYPRELMKIREFGVEIWVCSKCRWTRPYPHLVRKGEDSRECLLKEFAGHVCADHPPAKIPRTFNSGGM